MPTSETQTLVTFEILVNGSAIGEARRTALLDAVVEQSSELPDACTLRLGISVFGDEGEDLLAESAFPEGSALKVDVVDLQNQRSTLFEGEIVGVEMDLSSLGPSTLTVRAYHKAHRLMRGTKQRTFMNKKDSDMFSQVIREHGLSGTSAATTTVHEHTIQDNLSDWDFLQTLARRSGSRVTCRPGGKLDFDGFKGQVTKVDAKWGEDLLSFRPRTQGASQIDSVEVRGWDVKQKRAIVGTANSTTDGVPSVGTNVTKGKSGQSSAKHVLTNRIVPDQAAAEKLAASTLRAMRGRFLQMEAVCIGDAKFAPGKSLNVSNAGTRFSGEYPITSAVHLYSPDAGYTTQLFSSGRDAEGLLPLLSSAAGGAGGGAGGSMGRGSLTVGIVTDNNDPLKYGRVKVKYPGLTEDHQSFWARLVTPMGGSGRGLLTVPEVDDEVLIGFEQGDPNMPFVMGGLWNGKDLPPDDMAKVVKSGKVMHRSLKSRIGHNVLLDDDPSTQCVEIKTSGGHVVILDDKNKKIEVKTTAGNHLLLDDLNKAIELKDPQGNKIRIDSTPGNITMTALGNVKIDATQKVEIKGTAGVDITSPAPIKVESQAKLDLKANGMATFEAGGVGTVKAGGILTVQGALVKIN